MSRAGVAPAARASKKRGSFALEESLVTLIRKGDIEREDAQLCAIHPDDLNILLKSSATYRMEP